ncbi:protein kinase, putative, partial [Entamoeba invadens IP1]
ICNLCDTSMYYNKGECVPKMTGCAEQLVGGCLKCSTNYNLIESKCLSQSSDCILQNIKTCQICNNDVISIKGSCTKDTFCKYGMTTNTQTCILCYGNSVTDNTGICSSVNDKCVYGSGSICYQYINGTYLSQSNEEMSCENSDICLYLAVENKIVDLKCKRDMYQSGDKHMCNTDNLCIQGVTNDCMQCDEGHHIINGKCVTNTNCTIQNSDVCISCDTITISGRCATIKNCNIYNHNVCSMCQSGYYKTDTECVDISISKYTGCTTMFMQSGCVECSSEYYLESGLCHTQPNSTQKSELETDNCLERNQKGCFRCSDGFYLDNLKCIPCENNCVYCANKTFCTKCDDYSYLKNGACTQMNSLITVCTQMMSTYDGCVTCRDGYFKSIDGRNCDACNESCSTCLSGTSCLECNPSYYRIGYSGLCQPYSTLDNCINKTSHGCTLCEDGYYLSHLSKCEKCHSNCTSCESETVCLACTEDNILNELNLCVHYSNILNCLGAMKSKCSKCIDGYETQEFDTTCHKSKSNVGLVIGLSVAGFIILLIVGIIIIVLFVIFHSLRNEEKRKEAQVCVFLMKRSNVTMIPLPNGIVSSAKEIKYDETLPVLEESKGLICIGNNSKNTLKIQLTTMNTQHKYLIRTEPKIVTVKKGYACEFEIFVTPQCTCKLLDQVICVSLDIHKGEQYSTNIPLVFETELSTHLDPDELFEEKKIGNGSFGIVFLGTFRRKKVAIKKMKQSTNNEKMLDEFKKEVEMLDKFRSDYIIHFYGAVFDSSKICMVTEFAEYGSVQDLITKDHKNNTNVLYGKDKLRVKFISDLANGIKYLHENGILHRDIKPDNVLVVSLELNVRVNAKLTDFGSSRNINLLMTNMTFTKGVGTPIYMAPEILEKEKYKKSADIFSFGVTFYQTLVWDEIYKKSDTRFTYPWGVADYVCSGLRLEKTESMGDGEFEIISDCWCQDPNYRPSINSVVEKLYALEK